MKMILLVCVFVSLVRAGPSVADTAPPRLAFYRIDGVDDRLIDPITLTQSHVLPSEIPDHPPILTEAHIVRFCWDDQRVRLTDEGARRWEAQGGWEVPLTGFPLLVAVDGVPRYVAMLWNPLSSRGCLLPQIWCSVLDGNIRIGGRFISTEGDTIMGANYDPEVKRVLVELELLADPCPE